MQRFSRTKLTPIKEEDEVEETMQAPASPRPFTRLLLGSFNQSHYSFSDQSRDRQGVAICAMAFLMATFIKPLSQWSMELIGMCLIAGDEYYRKSVSALPVGQLEQSGRMFVKQLAPRAGIAGFNAYRLVVADSGIFCTLEIPKDNEIGAVTLEVGLKQFFDHFSQGIIIANKMARGIFKFTKSSLDSSYYLFDPHGIGADGLALEDDGKAAVMEFEDIEQMGGHLERLIRSTLKEEEEEGEDPAEQLTVELSGLNVVYDFDELFELCQKLPSIH